MKTPKLIPYHFSFPERNLITCFLFSCISLSPIYAQRVSTNRKGGTSFINNSTIGNLAFSNPANVSKEDQAFAQSGALAAVGQFKTNYLQATGFDLDIPPAAVVSSVSVSIQKKASGVLAGLTGLTSYVVDNEVRLIKNGQLYGENKATATHWPTTAVYEHYEGGAQYWKTNLTPADLNDRDFGVAFSATVNTLAEVTPRADVGFIGMKVEYELPAVLPLVLKEFHVKEKNGTAICDWTMEEEETGGSIYLQLSQNNQPWQNISAYHKLQNANDRPYSFNYHVNQTGNYQFRLQLISANGKITYSPVKGFTYAAKPNVNVYPIPAESHVYINGIPEQTKVEIFNSSGQQMQLSQTRTSSQTLCLHIAQLPRGIYYVKAGTALQKFVK